VQRIRRLLDRSAKIVLGAGAGFWVGLAVFWTAKIVFPLLGLKVRDPNFQQGGALEDVVNFAAISIFVGTFSAGGTSAFFTPWEWDWKTATNNLRLPAVASAVFGGIAGAWIGAGVGLVMLNLVAFGYLEPSQNLAVLCTIITGLSSGVAAAIAFRRWRKPQ
jgi:hypothetical protein